MWVGGLGGLGGLVWWWEWWGDSSRGREGGGNRFGVSMWEREGGGGGI